MFNKELPFVPFHKFYMESKNEINLEPATLEKIRNRIKNSNKILLISHAAPDGDSLGSCLGLYHSLRKINKNADLACIDEIPVCFNFLPGVKGFKRDFNPLDYDLIFIMDSGAYYMTGFHKKYPELFKKDKKVVNIDHHESNDFYGGENVVFPKACCTCAIVTKILRAFDFKFDSGIATCLLTGIYTDTGSFMHSNATPFTLRIASFLIKKGGDFRAISKNIFKTISVERLKLWGVALRNIKLSKKGFVISGVTKNDFDITNTAAEDLSGVVDYVNSVPEASFSILLTERDEKVKGSLRTLRDDINLSRIAEMFGGGGHRKAAGFSIKGRLRKELRFRIETEKKENLSEKID